MRCPSCGSLDTQVKDFAADRGLGRDPAPPRLPVLQLPLHDLRARAVARAGGDQAQRPPRAVRPRQADALAFDCAAQAAGRARAGRADGVEDRARAGKPRRERGDLGDHRRDGDGASARARRRGLCALRLGLSQFPRAQGFPAGARRTERRGRADQAARRRATDDGRGRSPCPNPRSARNSRARLALHAACARAGPPRARPHLAQPRGRRGRSSRTASSSAAAGPSPADGRTPRPRRSSAPARPRRAQRST